MIRVRRITHATFETPDLEAQLDHYARVLGLTVVERDGNRAFLSAGNDHHTVVLQKGTDARCVRLGFQLGGNDDLADFARHVEGHGIATARKSSFIVKLAALRRKTHFAATISALHCP